MDRCSICDITSDGRLSSHPFDKPKGLKFFSVGHLIICSQCEFTPNPKPPEMEDGEVELLENDFDE